MWRSSAKNGKRWKYVCSLFLAGLLILESVMPVLAVEAGEGAETAETTEIWMEDPASAQNEEDYDYDEAVTDQDTQSESGSVAEDAPQAVEEGGPGEEMTAEEEISSEETSSEAELSEPEDSSAANSDNAAEDMAEPDSDSSASASGAEPEAQTDLYEEDLVLPPVSKSITESDGEDDHEELFESYVDKLFSADTSSGTAGGPRRSRKNAGNRFSGAALTLYSELYSGITQIAAGQRDSAVFTFSVEDLGYGSDTGWSAQELGVEAVVVNGEITDEASDLTFSRFEQEVQIDDVIYALLTDCPYELYWHDKTSGVSRESGISAVYRNGEWRCFTTGEYVISLSVAEEFAVSIYTTDTARTGAASLAVENAQEILTDYENLSDMEKLTSYKDRICELVSYNYDAADGDVGYGNPWQLIWVFDEDLSTNVVCEGYAKAFQYLCDSTSFDNDSVCGYSVTGMMSGGTGEGLHMWNIVTLDDGRHYLADITNSDSGTVGQDGSLFLVPYTSGSVQSGYSFYIDDETDIDYVYDKEMDRIFTEEELTLSSYPYGTMPEEEQLEITLHPQAVTAVTGDQVSLHVEANKTDVTYQWQWSTDGNTWKNCSSSGYNTDTFSFQMLGKYAGRIYRCIVSSGDEQVTSDGAVVDLETVVITHQPADVEAYVGDSVSLHVEVDTSEAVYQWQYSTDGNTWKNCTSSGCKTDTFSFLMKASLDRRQYRCKISAYGADIFSNVITVSLCSLLEITLQPADVEASAGDPVSLHVEANTEDAAYQWQFCTDGVTWKNCTSSGCSTDTFSFLMKASLDQRQYRCKISAYGADIFSNVITVSLCSSLEITLQPEDVEASVGDPVSLHVEVNADDASYQWQFCTDGVTWKNCTSSGCKTDTFSFLMKASLDRRLYRCKVSSSGIEILSDVITVSLPSSLMIVVQPENVNAIPGDSVSMHVEANELDAVYQWQFSTDGKTWKKCTSAGCDTDTFSFLMKETLSGRRYRCVVSYGDTSLISDTAVINSVVAYGVWGTCDWEIDRNGVLTIHSGTGQDNPNGTSPWYNYADQITEIIASEDIVLPPLSHALFAIYWVEDYEPHSKCTKMDLSGLDTSNVTDMSWLFFGDTSLQHLDLSGFDTRMVTRMDNMFYDCIELLTLDISGFDTHNVTNMEYMFDKCWSLAALDVSGFDTSKVVNMSDMFAGCRSLASLDVSGFNTEQVTIMSKMFYECSGVAVLDVSGFYTGNVTSMFAMFANCVSLQALDVSGFDTGRVTDLGNMFQDCWEVPALDVSGFDTSCARNMECMFFQCHSLTELDVSGFNTANVENMGGLFEFCYNLKSIDVSGFETSKVKNMNYMFCYCSNLTELDVTGFDTANVTQMMNMFFGCNLLQELDVSGFDTRNVTTMINMFCYCHSLQDIDVSGFDTHNVKNIGAMFRGCMSLIELDLSNFDIGEDTITEELCRDCTKLNKLILPDSMNSIGPKAFDGCSEITIFTHSGTYVEQYCIDNGISYSIIG